MKQLVIILLFSIAFGNAVQAQNHFVYIQSDNKQPFNVVLNKKVFSSTASGYIIIPKLTDGLYNFTVGFAPGTFPDQNFSLTINKKDLGFSLKNFSEKGWGLFDLQSFGITYAGAPSVDLDTTEATKSQPPKKEEELISFNKPPAKAVEASEAKPVTVPDTTAIAKIVEVTADSISTTKDSIVENTTAEVKSDVKKVSESKEEDGVAFTYVDSSNLRMDTVQVIIPLSKRDKKKAEAKKAEEKKNEEKVEEVAKPNAEVKFLEPEPKMVVKETPTSANAIPVGINCKELASEDDYTKIRKKMARETSDEKMIAEATRAFKNKCFSTSQVKSLSTLFLSDEGRFNLFNATYTLVVDPQSYELLEKEFIDPAFANRFRTMLKS